MKIPDRVQGEAARPPASQQREVGTAPRRAPPAPRRKAVLHHLEAALPDRRDKDLVTVGGIIPENDIPILKAQGVAAVFTPGAPLDSIGSWLGEALDAREDALHP